MVIRLVGALLLALVAWTAPDSARAQDLTLRWLGSDGKVALEKTLNLAQLDALPQVTIDTGTPWTQNVQRFTGPSLGVLAALGGRPVREAKVMALNDYVAPIPAEDWKEHGAILTTRIDGQTMRIREKGPFWVMYPIDSDPVLRQQYYQSRMVWQVKSIDFIAQ
ncbi:hypothetical protein [Ancylobacter sp. IITR112]|uniref:hypothetical protein n=1 Tax=Ancylobacter sp. IITR112 TaxID=3138073 RepID=UPI003529D6C9